MVRSPASGIAWLLWRRHRWAAMAFLVYGTAVAILTHITDAAPAVSPRQPFFAAAMPLFFGLLYAMAVFTSPEADVTARQSGYPAHLLVLPVRTSELVLWPMLYGTVMVGLGWIALARLVMIPNGMPVPIGWAAAMLAALLACLQALFWSPVGLPYLRAVLALLLLPSMVALGVYGALNGASSPVLTGAFLAVIGPAYLAAIAGVSRARRGDSRELYWLPQRFGPSTAPRPRRQRRFWSPAQAQLWFEWRCNGIVLPLLVAGICLFLTVPLAWMRDLAPLGDSAMVPFPQVGQIEINLWLKLQRGCLLWPVIFASIVGCGLRKSDNRKKDLTLHPFFATRPMTSSALVLAKLQMAALSTLAAWAVMLVFVTAWLLIPARDGAATGPLGALLLRYCTPKIGLVALLTLMGLVVLTWKQQVEGLFIDLTGRRGLVNGYPIVVCGLITALCWFAGWVLGHPGSLPRLLELLPRLAALAAGLKLLAAVWVLHALWRERLLDASTLAKLGLAWLLLAGGLFALLCRLLPAGLLPPRCIALAVVLSLPLVRVAAAPLSLAWNRHR